MTDRPFPKVRPDLTDVEPYVSPQQPARYRMNTNESPYPPPQALVDEVAEELKATRFNRYPDKDAGALVEAVAAANDWPPEGVLIANGSNEVFLQLFLAFGGPGRTSLTFEPTYSLHTLIPRIGGTATVQAEREHPVGAADIGEDTLHEAMEEHRPDVVLFCSPNNPTGGTQDRATVEACLDRVPLVIVDEAYVEFARRGSSLRPLLDDNPNLVITKTFSKAWQLAGARLGYMLAHPDVVRSVSKVRLPYHLSAPTQLLGLAALRHADETAATIQKIVTERQRIYAGLTAMGVTAHPSEANFLLFDVGDGSDGGDPARTDEIWEALRAKGVLVRNYSSSPRLSGCLRVTAGLPEETDAFLDAMEEVVGATATI